MRKQQSLLFLALLLCGLCMANSLSYRGTVNYFPDSKPKKDSTIYLLHADQLSFDEFRNPNAQVLLGHVVFRHNGALLYCDSANFYRESNSFEAFRHVRMKQGDTLSLTGDYMDYDGYEQLAIVRGNVILTHRKTRLLTDSLNYDRVYDLGYFMEGGTLIDEDNTLTSDWGEYSPSTKNATFNYNVKLLNPKFSLTTDTLHYNTDTNVAHFTGPSNVDTRNDNNHIYSEDGYYNTKTEDANLLNRSVLVNPERRLVGDTVYYNKATGEGRGYGNVVATNLKDKNMLVGDIVYYNDSTGYAWATGKAIAKDYSQAKSDTLFLHADSLKMYSYNLKTDSVYRIIHAFHKGKVYRSDIQAVSDSIVYNQKDSCITLYAMPVAWNKNMQLTGEKITIWNNDSTIRQAHVENQAFSIEQIDSVHYNQIAGKDIWSYFENGEMYRTDVVGNVEFAYYPMEKDSTINMMHTGQATELRFYLKNRKIDKIWGGSEFSATGYPLPMIPADKFQLKNFLWLDYLRPLNKEDILEWRERRSSDVRTQGPKHVTPLVDLNKLKSKSKQN